MAGKPMSFPGSHLAVWNCRRSGSGSTGDLAPDSTVVATPHLGGAGLGNDPVHSVPSSKRIDECYATGFKISPVSGRKLKSVSEGSCGSETVLDRHRLSDRTQMRQQFGPARPRLGVPRHAVNAPGDLVEPMVEISAPSSRWKQKDTEAYLPENHRIDRQVAFVAPQPLDHPWIRTRLGRLAQHIGVDKTRHDCDPSESVDSDSIGANQPFTGHASSMFTKPWLSGPAATRRYSPLSTRSMSNAWPGSILS